MGSSILIWSHWYNGTLSDSESFKLFTSPLLKRCVLMWINEWCILNGYWISVILFYVHPGYGERTLPAWPPEVILFYLCAATVPALMLHPCFNQCYKKKKKDTLAKSLHIHSKKQMSNQPIYMEMDTVDIFIHSNALLPYQTLERKWSTLQLS